MTGRYPEHFRRWWRSERFRAVALQALRDINARRAALPKCGAKRKSDGGACQQPAMPNGRCRFHGGLTPKGDQWHKLRVPARSKSGAKSLARFDKKLEARERREREKKRKLATMTPDQRQAYEAWQQTHKPGSASARARARFLREQNAFLVELLEKPNQPVSDQIAALDALIDQIEAENCREGIFG
jgi:hypothetical protein